MIYMVPTVTDSFRALFETLPSNLDSLIESLPEMLSGFDEDTRETVIGAITTLADPLEEQLANIPALIEEHMNGDNVMDFLNNTVDVVMTVINFIIGIIISFYMLSTKESIAANGKKLCYAVLETGTADRFIQNMQRVNVIFQNFVRKTS